MYGTIFRGVLICAHKKDIAKPQHLIPSKYGRHSAASTPSFPLLVRILNLFRDRRASLTRETIHHFRVGGTARCDPHAATEQLPSREFSSTVFTSATKTTTLLRMPAELRIAEQRAEGGRQGGRAQTRSKRRYRRRRLSQRGHPASLLSSFAKVTFRAGQLGQRGRRARYGKPLRQTATADDPRQAGSDIPSANRKRASTLHKTLQTTKKAIRRLYLIAS